MWSIPYLEAHEPLQEGEKPKEARKKDLLRSEEEKQIEREPKPKAENEKGKHERTIGLRCCFEEMVLSVW